MANIRRALLTSEDAWKNLQKFYDENGTKLNMPSISYIIIRVNGPTFRANRE
jgi:plasmid maintenance system antidote protein VapI